MAIFPISQIRKAYRIKLFLFEAFWTVCADFFYRVIKLVAVSQFGVIVHPYWYLSFFLELSNDDWVSGQNLRCGADVLIRVILPI
jgi:hypothetical protein